MNHLKDTIPIIPAPVQVTLACGIKEVQVLVIIQIQLPRVTTLTPPGDPVVPLTVLVTILPGVLARLEAYILGQVLVRTTVVAAPMPVQLAAEIQACLFTVKIRLFYCLSRSLLMDPMVTVIHLI